MKKLFKPVCMLATAAIIVTLAGCGGKAPEKQAAPSSTNQNTVVSTAADDFVLANPNEVNHVGNSYGNITNAGLVARQGEWLYYSNPSDENKLYKVKLDGTGKLKLNGDKSSYINVVGDWAYYCNTSDNFKIYKVKTDGKDKTKVNDDKCSYINVVGDWMYYTNASDGNKLYKVKTDGSGRAKLNDEETGYINATDDWIYYSNWSDGNKVYKIKTDGTQKTKVSTDGSSFLTLAGDWLFYGNASGTLTKIKTDGTGGTAIGENIVYTVNASGDWIYFSSGSLFRIKPDGSQREMLDPDNSSTVMDVVGGWIYYINWDDNLLYRMRLNGKDKAMVD